MPSEEGSRGYLAEMMLSAPELCQGNRRGAGLGSRRNAEDERGSFESLSSLLPPHHLMGGQRSSNAAPGILLWHLQSRIVRGQKGNLEDCRKSSRRIRQTD